MRGLSCVPCFKKERRRTNEELIRALHDLARTKATLRAIELDNAKNERILAKQVLEMGDRVGAAQHLTNAAESEQKAEHQKGLYDNAIALINAIDNAAFNQQMSQLVMDSSENLQELVSKTPDLTEAIERLRGKEEELYLPDAPTRPLLTASVSSSKEQRIALLEPN